VANIFLFAFSLGFITISLWIEVEEITHKEKYNVSDEKVLETLTALGALGIKTTPSNIMRACMKGLISKAEMTAIFEWAHTHRKLSRNWWRALVWQAY